MVGHVVFDRDAVGAEEEGEEGEVGGYGVAGSWGWWVGWVLVLERGVDSESVCEFWIVCGLWVACGFAWTTLICAIVAGLARHQDTGGSQRYGLESW